MPYVFLASPGLKHCWPTRAACWSPRHCGEGGGGGGGGGYAPFTLTYYMHRCNISTMESDSLHREEFLSEHLLSVWGTEHVQYSNLYKQSNVLSLTVEATYTIR